MVCPHCLVAIHEGSNHIKLTELRDHKGSLENWVAYTQVCPSCSQDIIWLGLREFIRGQSGHTQTGEQKFIAWPKRTTRRPVAPEVPKEYADDYSEACLTLENSPKASAALSRRCLQNLLRNIAKVKPGTLEQEIQEAIDSKGLPTYLIESIDAVRSIGNFSAHPMKSQRTGEIIEVESGEAEWSLDALEAFFDFYFVQPKAIAKKRDALNAKLSEAGKPPLKK